MALRDLDLNLLKALDVLIEERHVTRAAERLGVTQPAMSATLNRLRDAFGDALLVKTRRIMVPTERALALTDTVRRILAEVEAMVVPEDFDPESASFTVRVSATDYAMKAIVMPFAARLRAIAPKVRIAVLPAHGMDLMERMERGELDMAILTPELAHPDMHSRTLFEEHYVFVSRDNHPQVPGTTLDLDTFCSLQHGIVSLDGGGFFGATDAALRTLGRQRTVALSVPSFGILLDVVRKTDLVAMVPSHLVVGESGLKASIPPIEVAGFTKIVAWHARTHADPRHRWARTLLAEASRDATSRSGSL